MHTDPSTSKTRALQTAARAQLIEYSTMQARTGLQMIRNALEADPRLVETYEALLASLHRLEDEINSARSGPPSTPSARAT